MKVHDITQVESSDSTMLFNEKYGNNSSSIISPKSENEISEILKEAYHHGKKVSILAGGTKRSYGGLKETYDLILSLADYKGIVEHTVGDMTITVKAGTTISDLQNYLRVHDQMVAIDPSWPDQATIGGVIAANESGTKRMGYGSARDLVIGLRVAYPDGEIIRTGGKVVKNVAGYDMNKLFIGSMGTLGVICEVTLKLRPIPKYESLVLVSVPEEDIEELKSFAVKIQNSMIEPVSLELVNSSLSKKVVNREEYTLLIAFEDVENAVHYQEEWVEKHKPVSAVTKILTLNKAREFWNSFSNLAPNSLNDKEIEVTKVALKIGSKNMDVMDIMKESQGIHIENRLDIEAHGGLGHGISHFTISGQEEAIKSAIFQLREIVAKKKGYVILKHLPYKLREEMNVWGDNPSYFFLMEGIKRKVDRRNILNHQRFLGGI
ncbi:FAD-binding oxidoreductase [Jeotgalibacillus marinus]|uniref:FAD-binding oxidoreductase n=1 Tax=Jeotgalibacillus marinus TaxID=86667 RepID=A0ABV3Q7C6_9BACL